MLYEIQSNPPSITQQRPHRFPNRRRWRSLFCLAIARFAFLISFPTSPQTRMDYLEDRIAERKLHHVKIETASTLLGQGSKGDSLQKIRLVVLPLETKPQH